MFSFQIGIGSTKRPPRAAFSISDLLIVIAILGILLALLLPALNTTRESARRALCAANEKQLALSVMTFEEQQRRYPAAVFFEGQRKWEGKWSDCVPASAKEDKTKAPYSFLVRLLPFMEEARLYDAINFQKPAFDKENFKFAGRAVPVFNCPSYGGPNRSEAREYAAGVPAALTQYKGLGATTLAVLNDRAACTGAKGDGGLLQPYQFTRSFPGTSLTLMLCETKEPRYAAWYDGTTIAIPGFHPEIDRQKEATTPALNYKTAAHPVFLTKARFGGRDDMQWGPSSHHPGMTIHVFCDGAARAIDNDIDASIYKAILTRTAEDNKDIPAWFMQ